MKKYNIIKKKKFYIFIYFIKFLFFIYFIYRTKFFYFNNNFRKLHKSYIDIFKKKYENKK